MGGGKRPYLPQLPRARRGTRSPPPPRTPCGEVVTPLRGDGREPFPPLRRGSGRGAGGAVVDFLPLSEGSWGRVEPLWGGGEGLKGS